MCQKPFVTLILMLGWVFTFIFLFSNFSYAVSGWVKVHSDSSVVKINGSSGGACTGTRVSKDGYILTARHCFNGCLISGGFVDSYSLFPEYGWRSPKLYQMNKKATCSISINDEVKNVEVVAIGPGFMIPTEQRSLSLYDKDLYLSFLEKSYFHNGDFAIIKEDSSTQNCKSVNWASALEGEDVHYHGYPSKSFGRPEGRNSDGESLLKGEGVVSSSIVNSSCLGSNAKNIDELIVRFDREDVMLSTVDNLPGASGSSLLNNSGEIVALINSHYRFGVDVEKTYCSGATVAIPTYHILRQLEVMGFGQKIDEFFSCSEG